MQLEDFLKKLADTPEQIAFADTIATIDTHYDFSPTEFRNGDAVNEAGKNSGSCKIFHFAQLNGLNEQQTLHCFGDYYRQDVLQNPDGTDHQNIRNFMRLGWSGISFAGTPLSPHR